MKVRICLGAGVLLLSSFAVFAADAPKMSPQEKAEMDAMMKAATPGEPHKKLAEMVGTFDATVKMWPAPNAPAQTSQGVSTNKSVLGGRWIQEDFTGSMMGAPFTGIGYTGYDNVTKKYVGTWMDSMSTGAMTSTGKANADGSYDFSAWMPDPMRGKNVEMKEKVTVVNKDKHIMEMWGPDRSGKQYRMMEITYTRKKS